LAWKSVVDWESLDLAGRAEIASAAMSELGHLGVETHAKVLALKRGVDWKSLDPARRTEIVPAAMSELGHLGATSSGKMLAEVATFEEWDKLTDEQRLSTQSW